MPTRAWTRVRSYLPLLAVVVVQLIIIAAFPSVYGGSAAPAGPATPGAATDAGYSGPAAAGLPGDRSHCSGVREFPTSIDPYAPPCTSGTVGGTYDNGGSTSPGVSGKTITIVAYYANIGAALESIAKSENLYVSYPQTTQVNQAFQNFINSHYVLWGRKVKVETYQGSCMTVPPDQTCLLAEMDSIVNTYHPYAVFWATSVCSACFARLAQDHTVVIGGVGFSDAFAQANAPYYWSAGESSTHIEEGFARFWCNQLTSKGTDRVVSFAPDKNPAQDFNGRKRVLGVISTNDPDNEDTVTNVLIPALNRDCGDGGSVAQHHYYYAQDLSTVAQQVSAGVSTMDTPDDPATDVLCLCDPIAPQLMYAGAEQHNYWPENLLADVQGIGVDGIAQGYEASAHQQSLACPQPQVGCGFDDAFGILSTAVLPPPDRQPGPLVFRDGGGTTLPEQAYLATGAWEDLNMLASLIENTGPDLTPARMAAAAPSMGTIGGGTTGLAQVGFSRGSYNWTIDARVVYWDRNKTSPYNGKPGTFVNIEGKRFLPDQYPKLSEPPVPEHRG